MKKVLNVIGIILSLVISCILVSLIFTYVLLINTKGLITKDTLTKVLTNTDITTTLQESGEGETWESITKFGNDYGIDEEQLKQIIKSKEMSTEAASYLNKIINSIGTGESFNLTEEELKNSINKLIEEYNSVSDNKISDENKDQLLNSVNEETVNNINESVEKLNISSSIPEEYIEIYKTAEGFLFGNYSNIMLTIIIITICIIALLRFSYYKWMPYVGVSSIIAGLMLAVTNFAFSIYQIEDSGIVTVINPIKDTFVSNLYIDIVILFIISIILFVLHHLIKKFVKENKQNELAV